ncbi:6-phosphogluconolactonase [Algoriphagus halophilus]|uniref:Galactosamine-6-phosphate isomerase n=1 Tax=Algoriphagus halophilus TaxID=226505 RepID=A0A1N6DQK4_9BACT|nr:6-phosphogluconolactonase [Algoriphagus halophilus]SIN72944.1 galactosamine-6-phosphate isomerase [Algoriphagus halophilus]
MNIHYCPDFDQMSQKGADLVHLAIAKKPNLLFCAASGGSPTGLYKLMVKKHHSNSEFFNRIHVVKLDEWVGLPENSEFTSEFDIQQKLLQQIEIPSERYLSFNAQTKNPKAECERVQESLGKIGPIDICILGIGQNGHIALNEPAKSLSVDCHVAKLSEITLSSGMIQNVGVLLEEGMTLGIGNILRSKMVILLIAGKGKEKALKALLKKEITPQLPASMLWLHPNVHVIIDESSIAS